MSFGMMMDILITACGVYIIYWAMQMIQSKKIPEMLIGKGFPISRAKDPEGFIKKTFPMTLILGILLFVAGVIGALEIFALYPYVDTVISIFLVIVIILYGVFLMRAQKKYLVGIDSNNKKRK